MVMVTFKMGFTTSILLPPKANLLLLLLLLLLSSSSLSLSLSLLLLLRRVSCSFIVPISQ